MAVGIYSKKHSRRFWYVAIPKTGSQSILKAIVDATPDDRKTLYGSDVNNRSVHHMPVFDFFNYLSKNDFQAAEFFTVIRNPFWKHASHFIYQREKTLAKIKAVEEGTPLDYQEGTTFKPDDKEWVADLYKLIDGPLNSFEAYCNFLNWGFENHYHQNWKPMRKDWPTWFIQPISWWIHSPRPQACTALPIESPKLIQEFCKKELDISIDIPHINSSGRTKDFYKELYTQKTRNIIYKVERKWIDAFGYEAA